MRKALIPLLALLVLVPGVAAVTAQEATPTATDRHPFVGTWLFDRDADDPENVPEVILVTDEGGYIATGAEGLATLGVWEPTGERTAVVTTTSTGMDENGNFVGTFVVRASVEVEESGDTFTAQYTTEVIEADRTGTGEAGPTNATATRLHPEPMGTPVAGTPAG